MNFELQYESDLSSVPTGVIARYARSVLQAKSQRYEYKFISIN